MEEKGSLAWRSKIPENKIYTNYKKGIKNIIYEKGNFCNTLFIAMIMVPLHFSKLSRVGSFKIEIKFILF